ncbi:unnamed protein product [Musa acuminata subsp. burmannicoides]
MDYIKTVSDCSYIRKFSVSQNVGACYTILLEILRCMVFSMQLHLDLLKLVQVKIQPWLALECLWKALSKILLFMI